LCDYSVTTARSLCRYASKREAESFLASLSFLQTREIFVDDLLTTSILFSLVPAALNSLRSVKVESVFKLNVHRNRAAIFRGRVKLDLTCCGDCAFCQPKRKPRDGAEVGHLPARSKHSAQYNRSDYLVLSRFFGVLRFRF